MKMVWVATVLVLLVLSATLSLAAINRCTTTLDLPGDNSSHIGANAALLFLVAAGALTWKRTAHLNSQRLFELWCSWWPASISSFGTVVALTYYALTFTSCTTRPKSALGPVNLPWSWTSITTSMTHWLLQLAPQPSNCLAFPEHPLALLACAAITAYYIAAGVMLAEKGFSLSPIAPNSTLTPQAQANAGQRAPSALQTTPLAYYTKLNISTEFSSNLDPLDPTPPRAWDPSRGKTSTTQPPPPIRNAPPAPPVTTTSSSKPVSNSTATYTRSPPHFTGGVLYSGLSINRRVSSTPIFSGGEPSHPSSMPSPSTGSVLYSGLSINKEVSSMPILTRGRPILPAASPLLDSTIAQTDADEAYQDKQSVSETIFEHRDSGDKDQNIPNDKMSAKKDEVAVANDAAEPAGLAKLRRTSTFIPVNPVNIAAQAGVEGQDLIPAVSAPLMRKSSSLKASWGKLVSIKDSLKDLRTEKGHAVGTYFKKKSMSRDAGTLLTPTSSLDPTPGAFSRRQSSLKRTASAVKDRLTPAACLGRGAVQV